MLLRGKEKDVYIDITQKKMYNPMNLIGKNVLIAGATGGIGEIITKTINDLGATLIAVVRDSNKMQSIIKKSNCKEIKIYEHDFNELVSIKKIVDNIVKENGKLDGFVYSAGINSEIPFRNMTDERIKRTMDVNFGAFTEFARCISSKRNSNDNASFVAISSVSSLKGDKAKLAYCASKAAMDASVRCMAYELTPKRGIRVNSIQPAGVATGMYLKYLDDNQNSEYVGTKLERQFIGLIDPYDIANCVAFFIK